MKEYPGVVDGLMVEREGGVLNLTLDRPERRNAITDDIVLALIDAIDAAGSDADVRVIHLTGSGDHFCSGFDLGLRGKREERPRTGATQRQMRWHVNRLIPVLLETQTPIVTSGRGWCIGLGLNLLLASDFAVVAEDARLWAPFVESGFTPDSGGSWLVTRMAGVARAKELLMLGRKVSGADAAAWGMIHRAVPAAQVGDEARSLCDELAGAATVAVGLTKALIQRAPTTTLEQQLAEEALSLELSSRSQDFKENSRARREKRKPAFSGR